MQGLDDKKHQNMIKAIDRFEKNAPACSDLIPENIEEIIRKQITEFKGMYDYYHILMKELEGCIKKYNGQHESLQRRLYPCVRKMETELRRKRRF